TLNKGAGMPFTVTDTPARSKGRGFTPATTVPVTSVRSVPNTVDRPPGLTPGSKLAAFTTTGPCESRGAAFAWIVRKNGVFRAGAALTSAEIPKQQTRAAARFTNVRCAAE